jgi:hypothetical protein
MRWPSDPQKSGNLPLAGHVQATLAPGPTGEGVVDRADQVPDPHALPSRPSVRGNPFVIL